MISELYLHFFWVHVKAKVFSHISLYYFEIVCFKLIYILLLFLLSYSESLQTSWVFSYVLWGNNRLKCISFIYNTRWLKFLFHFLQFYTTYLLKLNILESCNWLIFNTFWHNVIIDFPCRKKKHIRLLLNIKYFVMKLLWALQIDLCVICTAQYDLM